MTIRKYEFTGKENDGLKQIHRLSDGRIGGWIQNEDNLSHYGCCWVHDDAIVRDNARVSGNAMIKDVAVVCGNAVVCDYAVVCSNAYVGGYARAHDNVIIGGNSRTSGYAVIERNAHVTGNAVIDGRAIVAGMVYDKAVITNVACIHGHMTIGNNTFIGCANDFFTIVTSSFRLTWFRSNDLLRIGCMEHTVAEWWVITAGPLANKHPEITKIFRERFAESKPDGLILAEVLEIE